MPEPVEPALTARAASRWYTEHTALLLTTFKWSLLGAGAGFCVGWGTRAFLWALAEGTALVARWLPHGLQPWHLLPLALPACVFLIRTFAPTASGHGTEAVIEAVHQRSGRIDWLVAPVKLFATVLTLAFGGSVGKEGPCAQIGAALTSLAADALRLTDEDRRRLVICGIGAGFAAVFGTPVSGALFGIEVLYLGRIEYGVLFPCLLAGIVAHLVCGVTPPVPLIHPDVAFLSRGTAIPWSIAAGVFFGLVALLAGLYTVTGPAYAGLGTATIEAALASAGGIFVLAFLIKIVATTLTLETGGSGGIVTPLFFIGATAGAAFGRIAHLPEGMTAALGFVSVLAAAANTPIAAAVMGVELLPRSVGVYAALSAGTAFLIVGHRSVYASQKLGLAKSAALELPLGGPIGDVTRSHLRVREGSLTHAVHDGMSRRPWRRRKRG